MKKFVPIIPYLFILWLFAVFAGFYVVQKPFTPEAAAALANTLLDLLAAAWLGLLGLGLGHRLLTFKRSNVQTLSTGELFILGCGLGLGALGLLTLGLGLIGLFYHWLFITLSLLLTLVLWPDFLALYRRLRRPTALPSRLVLIYLLAVGLCTLAAALLPPTDLDGLFYHLTASKLFIQAHRIISGIDIPHFNFPFLAEMLFTYGMLLRGDIAAKLIHTLYGLLLTGLVYLTAQRYLSRQSAWPAVLILLSIPMVVTLAGWAYNDLTLAFYQLAALYAFIRGIGIGDQELGARDQNLNLQSPIPNLQSPISNPQSPISNPQSPISNPQPPISNLQSLSSNPRWLILSGVFAGLAMGLKYTSFVTPLTISLILLWQLIVQKKLTIHKSAKSTPPQANQQAPFTIHNSQFTIHNFLLFAIPAFLIALPWYLKNFFFSGNPFYPFLSNVFAGTFWDSFRAAWYAQAGTGIGFDVKTLIALPVSATLGLDIFGGSFTDINYFDGRSGPLILAFLPLILLYGLFRYRARAPERPPALDILLIFALAQFLFWVFGVVWSRSLWQARLLLPCLVALSPVVGWLWQDLAHLDRPQFSIRRFANLLIGLALLLNLIELSLNFIALNPLAYLSGHETRAEYLTRRLGAYYATLEELNETLPAQAVVLFLWEPRSYFCRVECRPDSILDQLTHDQHVYGSAANIVAAWKKAGITHVLLHRQGLEFIKGEKDAAAPYQSALAQLTVLESQYFEPVFDVVGAYQLYRLK